MITIIIISCNSRNRASELLYPSAPPGCAVSLRRAVSTLAQSPCLKEHKPAASKRFFLVFSTCPYTFQLTYFLAK